MKTTDRICVAVGAGLAGTAIAALWTWVASRAVMDDELFHPSPLRTLFLVIGTATALVGWGITGALPRRSP